MSTIKVDTLQDTGGKGWYPARVWVNFNGTGTIAIRDDGNVSSLTDNTTGDYTINFSNALTDADHAMSGAITNTTGQGGTVTNNVSSTQTASLQRLLCLTSGGSAFDGAIVTMSTVR